MMGRVSINGGPGNGTTPVSDAFIEEYMAAANDVQIKVYLYVLYVMHAGFTTDVSDLADRFNYPEQDIRRAIRYWDRAGLMQASWDAEDRLLTLRIEDRVPETRKQTSTVTSTVVRPFVPTFVKPAAFDDSLEDPALKQILAVIEQYIGSPLSRTDTDTILYIRQELNFSDALLDYLVQYCVELGKKRFSYIKSVAMDWHRHGITTVEEAHVKAEEFRMAQNKKRTARTTSAVLNSSTVSMPSEQYKNYQQNQYDYDALEARLLQN